MPHRFYLRHYYVKKDSCDVWFLVNFQSLASHVAARARDISGSTDSLDDEVRDFCLSQKLRLLWFLLSINENLFSAFLWQSSHIYCRYQ